MSLFLTGGGLSSVLDPVFDSFIEAARSRGSRIAVIMPGASAEETLDSALAHFTGTLKQHWPEVEIEPLVLTAETQWDEDNPFAGLIVAGISTNDAALDAEQAQEFVASTLVHKENLRRLTRSGTPYVGIGIGAQIVATNLTLPTELGDNSENRSTTLDGLGLIGSAVHVHAASGQLLDNAISAHFTSTARSAVAIDTNACLIIDLSSGRSDIIGSGPVYWLNRDGDEVRIRRTHQKSPAPDIKEDELEENLSKPSDKDND